MSSTRCEAGFETYAAAKIRIIGVFAKTRSAARATAAVITPRPRYETPVRSPDPTADSGVEPPDIRPRRQPDAAHGFAADHYGEILRRGGLRNEGVRIARRIGTLQLPKIPGQDNRIDLPENFPKFPALRLSPLQKNPPGAMSGG
ncbi:hypothetical protein AAAX65_03295 [Alistipes finegoldii]